MKLYRFESLFFDGTVITRKFCVGVPLNIQSIYLSIRLRLRKDNLEFALDVMTSMCFVHSKSSLTVTPRYLASFTSSSTCPDNSYWDGMGVCFLDSTLIILHLAAVNLIPHVDPQFSSKFRSFCRLF